MDREDDVSDEGTTLVGIRESGDVKMYVVVKGGFPVLPTVYTLKGYCRGQVPCKTNEAAVKFLYEAFREGRTVEHEEFAAHLDALKGEDRVLVDLLLGRKPPPPTEGMAHVKLTSEIYENDGLFGCILRINGDEAQRTTAVHATQEEARKVGAQILDHTARKMREKRPDLAIDRAPGDEGEQPR